MFKKLKRSPLAVILVPTIIIILAVILPPLLKALRSIFTGGASVADAAKNIASGAADEATRLAAAVGLGTDPGAAQADIAQSPPITNFWNVDYWNQQDSSPTDVDGLSKIADDLHGATHWYGYDLNEVESLLSSATSKTGVSYVNYIFSSRYGESIPHWLLHGLWVKMSNKDFDALDNMLKQLPNF